MGILHLCCINPDWLPLFMHYRRKGIEDKTPELDMEKSQEEMSLNLTEAVYDSVPGIGYLITKSSYPANEPC